MSRQIIFRHYPWIALLMAGIAIPLAVSFGGGDRLTMVGAIIAGVLGFCYFAQQQKLAETQLFKILFTEFNERYDKMNGTLGDLGDIGGSIT